MSKNYEDLKLSDDFMFGKIMEDNNLCREVLECLLGKTVGELEDIETQREFRYALDGKPIRLDIYTRNDETIFDAEMQNLNHKRIDEYDLPKRSRFYQSVIDTDQLMKNQSYRRLPETNIIFICTFDPFGADLPQYTLRNRCDEIPEMELQDDAVKYFFNCTCQGIEIADNMQALYRYMMTGEPSDELTNKLHKAVEAGRRNELWRSEYMKELLHDFDVREEGRAEGREEGREEERINTEREKSRADAMEAKIRVLEDKVRELEAVIEGMKGDRR